MEWQKLNRAKPPCPELLCSLRVEGRLEIPEKVYISFILIIILLYLISTRQLVAV
jgi:hypothetical protein